jgi:hypothetical protein
MNAVLAALIASSANLSFDFIAVIRSADIFSVSDIMNDLKIINQ